MSGNCAGFEPQRFRPNFCKNCLKLKTEHTNIPTTNTTPQQPSKEALVEQLQNYKPLPSIPQTPSSINNQQQNNNPNSASNALKRPPQIKRDMPPTVIFPDTPLPAPPSPKPQATVSTLPPIPQYKRATAIYSSPQSNPNVNQKRLSSTVGLHNNKQIIKNKQTRGIRMSYIQQQQLKGEIPCAPKFIQHILLRSLLVDGMKLSVNDSDDLLRRAQGCIKTKQNEKIPQLLLDRRSVEFLRNHIQHIERFLDEQVDLRSVILTQSLARRFLVLKKYRHLNKDALAQLKRRNDNYFDLVRSEKQYVQTLERLVEHYIIPLRHSDFIAPYECASIFSNIELLGEEHKEFLKKIHTLEEGFPFITGIGKLFLDISNLLKGYSVFVSNFKNAINEVDRLQAENPKFENFLTERSANWIDLSTILSMPLNRMTQYEHMMKNLAENIPQGTEDYEDCIKALSVLSQSSAVIEMNLVQSADTAKIQACQRKLRADGPVSLIKPGRKLHCELKTKKNIVFLFTDIIIVAKPQSKSKTHRESHRGHIKSKEELFRVCIHSNIQEVEIVDLDSKTLEVKTKDGNTEKIPFLSLEEKTKWFRLFKSILEEKNRVKVFGVALADTVIREEKSNGIPTIVEKTIIYITQHHITHPGIFRVAGSKAEIDRLKAIYDLGGEEVKQLDLSAYGPFSVCDVLKLFFRSLPEPLLGYSLYKPIVDLMRDDNMTTEEKVPSMKELVLMWTPPFFVKVLKYLLTFLLKVASHSETNKMSTSNLSIVFGPTLLWSETNTLESAMDMPYINSFVQALIDHQEAIFGN